MEVTAEAERAFLKTSVGDLKFPWPLIFLRLAV